MDAYLNYVKQRVDSERGRYQSYGFDASLSAELLRQCMNSLFVTPIDRILPVALPQFIVDGSDAPNLQLLHSFCTTTCTIAALRDAWSKFIRHHGSRLLGMEVTAEREEVIIVKILEFRQTLSALVETCFNKDVSFVDAIKDSFEHFLNARQSRAAELLAKYAERSR